MDGNTRGMEQSSQLQVPYQTGESGLTLTIISRSKQVVVIQVVIELVNLHALFKSRCSWNEVMICLPERARKA